MGSAQAGTALITGPSAGSIDAPDSIMAIQPARSQPHGVRGACLRVFDAQSGMEAMTTPDIAVVFIALTRAASA